MGDFSLLTAQCLKAESKTESGRQLKLKLVDKLMKRLGVSTNQSKWLVRYPCYCFVATSYRLILGALLFIFLNWVITIS